MTFGTMLEVDEIFTTIWLSRSSKIRVKVRRWPQSPIGTIFYRLDALTPNQHCRNTEGNFRNSNELA